MPNVVYDNFFLSNEVEDQFKSHLDLQQFCTVDSTLAGEPGMKRKINVYKATDGTEKLGIGEGNTKSIEVSFTEKEYEILLAQNRFDYYDENEKTDPMCVSVGLAHMGTDLFNTINGDIFAEFKKADLSVSAAAPNFDAFVDAQAKLKLEVIEGTNIFGFVCPDDMAAVRKALKEDLKYVEAFAENGYVGTVGGVNLYVKKDATPKEIIVATKEAVTLFVKSGTEVETERNGNIRLNSIFARKYYLAALTNATKAVKIALS